MSRHGLATAVAPNHYGRSANVPGTQDAEGSGFTISDLAREFGVTLRTLRFYESRGLLSPARSGMTRIYSSRDRARLGLILKGKQLGFTLVEIRAMLANEEGKEPKGGKEPSASVGGLQLTKAQIAEQLELLRSQRSEIEAAIEELEGTLTRLSA
jgi:DNA-binding transcriptional MerR regulator